MLASGRLCIAHIRYDLAEGGSDELLKFHVYEYSEEQGTCA